MPRLYIDFKYSDEDAKSVLKCHSILDAALRSANKGRLEYHAGPMERLSSVIDQEGDGFHQIGTTRMGESTFNSVVEFRLPCARSTESIHSIKQRSAIIQVRQTADVCNGVTWNKSRTLDREAEIRKY